MYINTQPPQKRSDNFQNSNKRVSSLFNHDVNMLHECNSRFLIYMWMSVYTCISISLDSGYNL